MSLRDEQAAEYWIENVKHPIGMINANEHAEADVYLSSNFEQKDAVYRADVLQEVIYYLEKKYNQAVIDMGKD